jgi:hypothetical protein
MSGADAFRQTTSISATDLRERALPETTPDLVTELIRVRAWVVRLSHEVDGIADLPARRRGKEAARLAERMRDAMMATALVEACKR